MSDMIAEVDLAAKLKEVFQTPFLASRVDEDGDIYVSNGLGFPIGSGSSRTRHSSSSSYT